MNTADNRSYAPPLDLDALDREADAAARDKEADPVWRKIPALVTAARTGKAIWAIAVEYGFKHKAFCSMADSEDGSEPCDCLLVEKVHTAFKGNSK